VGVRGLFWGEFYLIIHKHRKFEPKFKIQNIPNLQSRQAVNGLQHHKNKDNFAGSLVWSCH
jgi:hypothetical protein